MLLGLKAHLRNIMQRLHSLNKLHALKSTGKFIYLFRDLIFGILHICQGEKSFERDGFTWLGEEKAKS